MLFVFILLSFGASAKGYTLQPVCNSVHNYIITPGRLLQWEFTAFSFPFFFFSWNSSLRFVIIKIPNCLSMNLLYLLYTMAYSPPWVCAITTKDSHQWVWYIGQGWKQAQAFWSSFGSSETRVLEQLWSNETRVLEHLNYVLEQVPKVKCLW